MIYAAIDVSGNPGEGNSKFMGIVLVTDDHLKSIINHIELKQILLSTSKLARIRDKLSSKLEFNTKESAVFCLRIEKDRIITNIKKMMDKKHRRTPNARIYQKYYQIIFSQIRDEIITFAKNYNYELSEIIFQCDDDCKHFLKKNGLQYNLIKQKNVIPNKNHKNGNAYYDDETYAYVLSDLVAWSNNRGREPKGVTPKNLEDILEKELKRSFR